MQFPLSDDPKAVALAFVAEYPLLFRPDFGDWLTRNWEIWELFEREAHAVWKRGRRRYAARRIIEWIRHDTDKREGPPSEFKINGNYIPDITRLYLQLYPDRWGFFEVRHLRDSNVRAM